MPILVDYCVTAILERQKATANLHLEDTFQFGTDKCWKDFWGQKELSIGALYEILAAA